MKNYIKDFKQFSKVNEAVDFEPEVGLSKDTSTVTVYTIKSGKKQPKVPEVKTELSEDQKTGGPILKITLPNGAIGYDEAFVAEILDRVTDKVFTFKLTPNNIRASEAKGLPRKLITKKANVKGGEIKVSWNWSFKNIRIKKPSRSAAMSASEVTRKAAQGRGPAG